MHVLRIADELITRMMQEIYLWIFDRTGVYIGSLMVVHAALITALALPMHEGNFWKIFCAGFLLICLMIAGTVWHLQMISSNSLFNAVALSYRDNMLRPCLLVFFCVVGVADAISGKFYDAAWDALLCLNNYYQCIMIRDREPKGWLPSSMKASTETGAA